MDSNYRANIGKWLPRASAGLDKYFADSRALAETMARLARRIAALLRLASSTTDSCDQAVRIRRIFPLLLDFYSCSLLRRLLYSFSPRPSSFLFLHAHFAFFAAAFQLFYAAECWVTRLRVFPQRTALCISPADCCRCYYAAGAAGFFHLFM